MNLTKKEEKDYLENSEVCPKCKSDNITGVGQVQTDSSCAWQEVICNDCEFEWQDIYKLVDINPYYLKVDQLN